jgi:hypothetical protein
MIGDQQQRTLCRHALSALDLNSPDHPLQRPGAPGIEPRFAHNPVVVRDFTRHALRRNSGEQLQEAPAAAQPTQAKAEQEIINAHPRERFDLLGPVPHRYACARAMR